jgi:hypothetical protein
VKPTVGQNRANRLGRPRRTLKSRPAPECCSL